MSELQTLVEILAYGTEKQCEDGGYSISMHKNENFIMTITETASIH